MSRLRQSLESRGVTRRARLLSYLAITLVMFGMATGCGTTPAERIATVQNTLSGYEAKADSIHTSIESVQNMITEAEAMLATADAEATAKLLAFIADRRAEIEKLQAQLPKVDEAIATWQARLVEVTKNPNLTWADEATVYGTGLQVSAPLFGPYGWIASGLGLLLVTVGGIFSAKQKAKATEYSSALTQVVQGVSSLVSADKFHSAAEIKKTLKAHQTPDTRWLVDQIRPA